MAHETLRIELGGAEIDGLYEDLLSLEVELDEELAGMVRFTLALVPLPDGSYRYLDDARLVPWQSIVVTGGPAGGEQQLISGFVTHVRPEFGEDLDDCQLHVWGMDASVRMDRTDILKDWPNTKDSDIAKATFAAYGLDPQVTDTPVVHDQDVSTIIQRETDMQFLKRLADRNGYECFVEGQTGWFRPPQVSMTTALPVLAVLFGPETNVIRFDLEVDALAPSDVAMAQVDRMDKSVLSRITITSELPALGARRIGDYLQPGMAPGSVTLGQVAVTGAQELAGLCAALYEEGSWFVTGQGEVDGNSYAGVLMPRATITIKGIGQTYSGNYVVTRVTHTFSPDGYRQVFGVKRNALQPVGTEDFAAVRAVLPVSLATATVLAELTT
jgi:phage protein D